MNRVFVTGVGVESCAGRTIPDFWDALREGRSGIRPLNPPDSLDFGCSVAGQVRGFDPAEAAGRAMPRRLSRFQQLAISAAIRALDDAGLSPGSDPDLAIYVGTSLAGFPEVDRYYRVGERGWILSDRTGPTKYLPHAAAAATAELLHARGPAITLSTACAASTDALGTAWGLLRAGATQRALACGVEAWITQAGVGSFARLGALTSAGPESAATACRPFDVGRDGVVPSEGAGALLLETEQAMLARGGQPLVEVLGYGASCDAYHPLKPRPDGSVAAEAIVRALASAGLKPEQIDHVDAHATSTPLNDVAETRAIRRVFGGHADRLSVTASKSVLGHSLGAGGALECIALALAISRSYLPPVANLVNKDPECDLAVLPGPGRPAAVEVAVKLSFGFGGENAVLIFGRVQ